MPVSVRLHRRHSEPMVAAIDIGTSKVCCLIAIGGAEGPRIRGLGLQRALGIKAGTIINADAAEQTLREAICQAERAAGVTIERASIAVSCGRLSAQRFVARTETDTGIVTDGDVTRILAGGEAYAERAGRMLVQLHNDMWQLDGAGGVPDPRGMAARALAAEVVAVTADEGPLRNLLTVAERCYLEAEHLLAAPFASARAVTTEEERRHGVVVLDLGAGVTSIAAFAEEQLMIAEAIPYGAGLITIDIARRLATSEEEAERLKVRHGTVLAAASNHHELVTYPRHDGMHASPAQVSRAELCAIIVPRVDAMAAAVAERLQDAGLRPGAVERIVLTGGGALLAGIDTYLSTALQGTARIGLPPPLAGAPETFFTPAFATVSGLVLDSLEAHLASRISGAWRRPRSHYAAWVESLLRGRSR